MTRQKRRTDRPLLTRNLRVGLLGSPKYWTDIDFDSWGRQRIDLSLLAFGRTSSANRQDLLVVGEEVVNESESGYSATPNEDSIMEIHIPGGCLNSISPPTLIQKFDDGLEDVLSQVWVALHTHESKYLDIHQAIAKYATEVIRISRLMDIPQPHIQNQALQHLVTCPWRNSYELAIAIARILYYSDSDVLKENYVKDQVHHFGTSMRGVNNCEDSVGLLRDFVSDIVHSYSMQASLEIFQARLTPFAIQLPAQSKNTGERSTRHRKAA